MDQTHLSVVSHHGRPDSPSSVNYISTNTDVWSHPKQKSIIVLDDPELPLTRLSIPSPVFRLKSGRRVRFQARAKTAFKNARKGLRMVSALARPSGTASSATSIANLRRAESRVSMRVRQSVVEPSVKRAGTPSDCLTRPTHRGTNVRLSIHQGVPASEVSLPSYRDTNVRLSIHRAPPSPEATQAFSVTVESPVIDGEDDKRKSMRFNHPVVSHVIVEHAASNRDSSGDETIGEESASVIAGTPTTIATVDFEDQVNPTRMFRHSRSVRDGQSFDAFKDMMDGVGIKAMPRAPARPPTLPCIPWVPALQLEDDEDSASTKTVTPTTEERVVPAARESPTVTFADIVHPNTLAIGSGVPLSKPRTTTARPHTTGELISGVNVLPYLPFNPRFNPYDRTSTPTPAPDAPQPAADDLAAAFEEAEAVEQFIAHQRHTTFYEEIEGSLFPPPLVKAAPVHRIKRKAVPTASAPPAPAPASNAAGSAPATSKPLPPVPAPGSPRRYTRGFVPPALAMNDNGYPMLEKQSKREQQQKKESKKAKKKKSVCKRTQSQKVRAVEKALRKLF